MRKLITFILLFSFLSIFSQEKRYFVNEVTLSNKVQYIHENNNDDVKFSCGNTEFANILSIGYIYRNIIGNFIINIEYMYNNNINNCVYHRNHKYISDQVNIPIAYNYSFFKKTWFISNIGFILNNNLIFNEEIKFYYGSPSSSGFIVIYEQSETKYRYQIAFALNAGLSFVIKKRYTLNINGFANIFSNYKLNPLGEEKLPYSLYGYSFGLGYKF